MIAHALAPDPRLLIADEPTTALDVTTQAQILDLMMSLQEERSMAIVLITHDLGVIAETADDVVVMYLGREVEQGSVENIFYEPLHPYTRALLRSIPAPGRGRPRPSFPPSPDPYPIRSTARAGAASIPAALTPSMAYATTKSRRPGHRPKAGRWFAICSAIERWPSPSMGEGHDRARRGREPIS